jgi:type III pantothenate kinase
MRALPLAPDVLCIDVGNSKILAVLYERGRERARWRLDMVAPGPLRRGFGAVLAGLDGAQGLPAIVASVAPRRSAPLVRALRGRRLRVHVAAWDDPWPFAIAVGAPQAVGVDRLANVAGLRALGLRRGVAVDAGTAITVDVLSERGFLGGLIAPGPGLALRSLHAHTEKLPLVAPPVLVAPFGRDTVSALRSGVARVVAGGAAAAAASLRAGLGRQAVVVLTGGGAATLEPYFPDGTRTEPDLLCIGLRALAARLQRRDRGSK